MSIPPPHHTCDRTKDRRESSGAPRVHFPLQRGKRLSFCFCVLDLKRWADAGGSFLDPPPPFAVHERKTSGGARGQTAWNADAATWASVSDASFSIGAFSRRKWKTRFQWQVLNSILMRLVGSKVKTSVSRGPSGGGVLLLHRNGRSRPRNCRDVSLFRQLESFRGQVDATALAEMLHCSFSPS